MMSVHLTFLQLFLLTILVTTTFSETLKPSRHDLENYLLKEKDYDKHFSPNKENATDVSVQLYITDFNKESTKEMEIEFTLNIRMNWTDQRLEFTKNETTFDVIPYGDYIVNSIWIPDLYFLQERKSLLHGLLKNDQLVYIFKNGSVFYSGRFNINSHCVMIFKKYPYDTQKCSIEIQSYSLTTNFIHLHWNGDKAVKIEPSMDPLKVEVTQQENNIETRYVYPEIGEFSMLKTEIVIPRPKGAYSVDVVIPPITLVVMSMMSFCLDYDIKTRMDIITDTLTPLFVHWATIYNKVSIDSTLDYLDYWMIVHIFATLVILVTNIIICQNKEHCDSKPKEPNPPADNPPAGNSNESETQFVFVTSNPSTSNQLANPPADNPPAGNSNEIGTQFLIVTSKPSTSNQPSSGNPESRKKNKCEQICSVKMIKDKCEQLVTNKKTWAFVGLFSIYLAMALVYIYAIWKK